MMPKEIHIEDFDQLLFFPSLPVSVRGYPVHTNFSASFKHISESVCPGLFGIFIEAKQIFHMLEKMTALLHKAAQRKKRKYCDHFNFWSKVSCLRIIKLQNSSVPLCAPPL